jgi:dTDP-glucose pyrophosphorylase
MRDWKNTILNQKATMKEAIETLDKESLRIVLVADQEKRLIGTITDGDIRRALLKHQSMETELTDFMQTSPITASITDSRDEILQKMHAFDLLQIPVIDNNDIVVRLELLRHLIQKARYDNPVFLMAGGFGQRLRPLTEHVPKPMLHVGQKPILETILEQFIEAGFYNFYISTHYKADVIYAYFGDGSDWDVNIHYVHEDKPLGTAGALGLLPSDLPDLPIIMMNGDLLTKVDFYELLSFYEEHDGVATMCVREYDFQVPYGVINSDEQKVTNIIEKPVQKFFVNAGIYVINPSLLKEVDGKAYLDMPHFLNDKIEQDEVVNMFPLHEYWLDIGQMEQFDQAQVDAVSLF